MGKNESNDHIYVGQLEIFAHIGVPEEERATAQRLTFGLTLWPIAPMGGLNDEIGRAVNYASVCAEVTKFVGQRRDRLRSIT